MKTLKTILQGFIGIRSLLILKFHLVILALGTFINQLADKKSDQTIERVFFVANIIVTQDLLKTIYNFIVRCEINQIFFLTGFYANIICL